MLWQGWHQTLLKIWIFFFLKTTIKNVAKCSVPMTRQPWARTRRRTIHKECTGAAQHGNPASVKSTTKRCRLLQNREQQSDSGNRIWALSKTRQTDFVELTFWLCGSCNKQKQRELHLYCICFRVGLLENFLQMEMPFFKKIYITTFFFWFAQRPLSFLDLLLLYLIFTNES